MNEEIKAASVDSPEFRVLLTDVSAAYNTGTLVVQRERALIAHINAWSDERCNEAISQLAASRAMLPVTDSDVMRAKFESWFSDEGANPKAVERNGDDYKLMSASSAWRTWQAASSYLATHVAGWVSVEERLPEENGWYAVIISDPCDIGWSTDIWWRARFHKGDWDGCDPVEDGQPVTHWKAIALPPALVTPTQQNQQEQSNG